MTMLRYCLILCSTLPFFVAHEAAAQPVADTVEVTVEGAVKAPGVYPLPAGARLADALIAAMPMPDAYVTGASLLRESARAQQVRLKAGLLYDLKVLQQSQNEAASKLASSLSRQLTDLPATGRVVAELEPRLMQTRKSSNPVAMPSDIVRYPARPDTVRVMGALDQACELPHQPTADVTHYLAACPSNRVADKDVVHVIQPDGHVQIIGIALWNRADLQAVAPGGTIYVPIAATLMKDIDPEFNTQFAAFLATQPLPNPRVAP
jgi:hypothetical protein